MRVLHLEAGTHLYGGALQALLLVEGLQARGVESVLVVPQGSEVESEAIRRNLSLHPLPMAGEADLRFPARFRSLIKSVSPDLVHLHSRRGADTLGGLGARWAGVPVIMTRRVDNPEAEWSLAAKYRLFDRVITISHAIRKVLIRQGVDPEKLTCVHSALDPGPYSKPCNPGFFKSEFGGDEDGPCVGMAAQFIPRKGHDVLLEAIPSILLDHPRARFLLFGKGPLHGEITEKIREAGLGDSVTLPGFREDLPAILPCLDLLVHPALMEGLGVVLLQAGASGVPTVASAVGGIPEAVVHDQTGLLVPAGNPGALALAVSELLANPEKARSLGEQARERMRSHFSVDRMVEGNLKVYRELVSDTAEG